MNFDDFTPELKEKARACKTADDLAALAQSEGIELSDEQLMAVSGAGPSEWVCSSECTQDCLRWTDCYRLCGYWND